jgi:4-amino-4-deoxy-L-arabinose transferase-like glycosyltransferase
MKANSINYNNYLYLLILLLLVPALLINLGAPVLIDDEALRAIVGLEMQYSGNYITPTINGEFYYKKPPLYNWVLLSFFELTGQVNEWTVRLPTVFFLLAYAATIYYYFRKHFDFQSSFVGALMLITCGRILFYDSMLGLIDTSYSLVTFTSFMIIYHQFEKKNWLNLFVLSYLLAAIGFLMKGLPSVVFQGATLLVYFVYRKEWRRLFSWQHILGGGVFLLIVGSYYGVYHQYNSLENVFTTLFTETSKRTVANYSIWRTISHLIAYPFEVIYHFLPWTLFLLLAFYKKIFTVVRQQRFIVFCVLCFTANILVYWTAPKVHPRYIFMLMPLLFALCLSLYNSSKEEKNYVYQFIYYLFGIGISLLSIASLAPLFLERTQHTNGLYIMVVLPFIFLSGLSYMYWKRKGSPLLILITALLVVRIVFNWFVIPDRIANDYGADCRETTTAVAQATLSQRIAVYDSTEMQPTNTFYLMVEREAIVPIHFDNFAPNTLYIIDTSFYPDVKYEPSMEFKVRHGKKNYQVGKLK